MRDRQIDAGVDEPRATSSVCVGCCPQSPLINDVMVVPVRECGRVYRGERDCSLHDKVRVQ
jgi:hypothetical protein